MVNKAYERGPYPIDLYKNWEDLSEKVHIQDVEDQI